MAPNLPSALKRMAKQRKESDELHAGMPIELRGYENSMQNQALRSRARFQSNYPVTWRNGAEERDGFYDSFWKHNREHKPECLYIESLQQALEARRETGDDSIPLPKPNADLAQVMRKHAGLYMLDKPRAEAFFYGLGLEACREATVGLEEHFLNYVADPPERRHDQAHAYRVARAISRFECVPEDTTCAWMAKSESDWQKLGFPKEAIQDDRIAEMTAAKAAKAAEEAAARSRKAAEDAEKKSRKAAEIAAKKSAKAAEDTATKSKKAAVMAAEKSAGVATKSQNKDAPASGDSDPELLPASIPVPKESTKRREIIKATGAKGTKASSKKPISTLAKNAPAPSSSTSKAKTAKDTRATNGETGDTTAEAYTRPTATGTSGNATWATIGPFASDADVVKVPPSKSNVKEADNKIWDCDDSTYYTPKIREWYKKRGLDIDDEEIQRKYLTLTLTLKRNQKTTKTWTWPAPDWNSQESVSKVVSDMGQMRHRECGPFGAAKKGWKPEEMAYLEDYFKAHPEKKGGVGMPMSDWQKLTDEFNAVFEGKIRTAHALWGKWDRDFVKKGKHPFGGAQSNNMGTKRKADADEATNGPAARKEARAGDSEGDMDDAMIDVPAEPFDPYMKDILLFPAPNDAGGIKGRPIKKASGVKIRLSGLKSSTEVESRKKSQTSESSQELEASKSSTDREVADPQLPNDAGLKAKGKAINTAAKKRKHSDEADTAVDGGNPVSDRHRKQSQSSSTSISTKSRSNASSTSSLIMSARMVEGRPRLMRVVDGDGSSVGDAVRFSIVDGLVRSAASQALEEADADEA